MPAEKPQRCTVVFHGHVQGVGFRFTTSEVASRYPITGYVMNQRDGTVLLVAEGPRQTVSSMIQSVFAAMTGYVTRDEQSWAPATGEFQGFGIRHR